MLMIRPVSRAQVVGQDLHVAGEDDDVDRVLLDEGQQPALLLGLRLRRDRQDDERDAMALGEGAAVSWFDTTRGISTGSSPLSYR
jgi:hypothetical protein